MLFSTFLSLCKYVRERAKTSGYLNWKLRNAAIWRCDKFDTTHLRIILTQSSERRRTLDTDALRRRVCTYIDTHANTEENRRERERERDTRVCSKQEHRKFVLSSGGNPRNPRTNIHGPPSLSFSLFLESILSSLPLLSMHLSLHSPEFLFYSLLSINVFSFPCSQNFLIISAKMRGSLSRAEYTIQLVLLSRIRKRSRVLTPIGEFYLRNIVWLFLIPIAIQIRSPFSYCIFLFFSLLARVKWNFMISNPTFNIRRLTIEKS